MKSKHTSMSIIHIKLKCFCRAENVSLDKRKNNIKIAGQIYWKLKLVYVLKIMLWLSLCQLVNICMSIFLHFSLRENTPQIGVKFLVFFFFFINFLMKTLIKSIIYCQTAPLDHLLMYFVKIVYRASLVSFLTWVSLEIFCLEKCQIEIVCSAQHHCHW